MLPAAAMTCSPLPAFVIAALAALPLAGCVKPPVSAPSAPIAAAAPAPVAAEKLALPLRTGAISWQAAGGGALPGGGALTEYVPEGETIADWTQMITALDLPVDQDPRARLAAILTALRGTCGRYSVVRSGPADTLVRCDDPSGTLADDPNILLHRHEVMWAKTVQGRSRSYVVWRAWHADTIPAGSILASATTRQEWQDWVDQVSLAKVGTLTAPGAGG